MSLRDQCDRCGNEMHDCSCVVLGAGPGPLFDQRRGEIGREEGIERAGRAAPDDWASEALQAVLLVAEHRARFTTDAAQFLLDRRGVSPPPEPRAWGAVMRQAAGKGWIERTEDTSRSVKAASHRRDKRVWRSLVCASEGSE